MSKNVKTIPGRCYGVTSMTGCTVTDSEGKVVATVRQGEQYFFQAISYHVVVSDDDALVLRVVIGR